MLELVLRDMVGDEDISTFNIRTSRHLFKAILNELQEGSLEVELIQHCLDADGDIIHKKILLMKSMRG